MKSLSSGILQSNKKIKIAKFTNKYINNAVIYKMVSTI